MWYTLPWVFDQFFHQFIPYEWTTQVHVFHRSSQRTTTTKKSSLRTLDASGQTLASCLSSLPHVVLDDYTETVHLSFNNLPIHINLPNLRNLTLLNSINCLNYSSRFPPTIRSLRILLFHRLPNSMPPNWPLVLHFLSTLSQLTSLRIFMYDLLKTVDDYSCQMIAKLAPLLCDFSFCFRYRHPSHEGNQFLKIAFKNHEKCIKQLFDYIILFTDKKAPCYFVESDGCGLTIWS